MNPNILKTLVIFLFCSFILNTSLYSQEGFDNKTRAVYILDIAKYVTYDDAIQYQADFKIAVLDKDQDFFFELSDMAKTRKFIQEKPIKVMRFREIEDIEKCHILYVNNEDGYDIKKVLKATQGNNTLVISEGYKFHEAMFNFVTVDGKPKFEINEELLKEEKLSVSSGLLAMSIKTREDWQNVAKETEIELDQEKEITAAQKVLIEQQQQQIAEQEKKIQEQLAKLAKLNEEIILKQKTLEAKSAQLRKQLVQITEQKQTLDEQSKSIASKETQIKEKEADLEVKNKEIAKKESLIKQQDTKIAAQLKEIEKQKLVMYFFIIVLIMVSGLGYFIYRSYRIKKKANIALEEKNKIIQEQKELAESQRDQIAYQKKHITDSIQYAKRIQTALLPSLELFSDEIDHFVLFKPRDIVSGDFYWVTKQNNTQVIIAADCTGHGVPGAFMSMLGVSLLNEIVINKKVTQPNEILNRLRTKIIESLKQTTGAAEGVKDGMDITICTIDYSTNLMEFAGAHNPLYFIRDNELSEIKGDKMPVAIYDKLDPFQIHSMELKKGDTFYIFSDGFVDQFGGPQQKKFLSKNFKNVLLEIQHLDMIEQGKKLDTVFEEWKKEVDQIDDVTVIGIRY
ncbi:MAG: DUF4154 domain-containing protein [Bacteroidales bacterium]|nr:DUF4154 domain-containing protein [Bacteroidales bacterium]